MIIEPLFTCNGDNSVQFKYNAADNTFTPNYTSDEVFGGSFGSVVNPILAALCNQNNNPDLLYLTRSGNTLHLYGNDGGDNTHFFDIQFDFDNMTYSQSYKLDNKAVSGLFTSLKIGGTNYGSYSDGTISGLTAGFEESYTITIGEQTYSVEFDDDGNLTAVNDEDFGQRQGYNRRQNLQFQRKYQEHNLQRGNWR